MSASSANPMDAARRLAAAWLTAWEKPAAAAAAKVVGDPRTLSIGGAWMSAQLAFQRACLATLDAAWPVKCETTADQECA